MCEEAAIPESAKSERNELADKMLTAGVSVGDTPEYENLLLTYACRVWRRTTATDLGRSSAGTFSAETVL